MTYNLTMERQGVLFDYPEVWVGYEDFLNFSPERQQEIEAATLEAESIIKECNFQCLSNCPLPLNQDCLYDDPDIGMFDLVEYPEFFWWRFEQVFGNSSEFLEITPDMMDEYFKEPDNPLQSRCPRCHSSRIVIGYPYIWCRHCGYNEPLIDYPQGLLDMVKVGE